MSNPFVKAVRTQSRLRLGLDGPSGSGKTYTALMAATAMAKGGKIAVIDTERNSASLYSDQFTFDVVCLDNFHPQNYVDMIHAAEEGGYAVIVIDSLSHAWEGEGGVLDQHDAAVKRQKVQNSFTAWKDVTPIHRDLVDAILQSKCHIIVTMRSKTEYVLEEVESNGRKIQRPKKVGMAPVQRQGMEYEFTIVADLDVDHVMVVSKSRMSDIADAVVTKPDVKWFQRIADWLGSAAPVTTSPPAPPAPKPNGNGSKPDQPAPAPAASQLDDLGQQLWPGQWEEQRKKLVDFYKGDEAKTIEMCQKRIASFEAATTLQPLLVHIAKAWSGYESYASKVNAQPAEWKRVLAGVARAVERNADGRLTEIQLLAIIEAELAIPEGF